MVGTTYIYNAVAIALSSLPKTDIGTFAVARFCVEHEIVLEIHVGQVQFQDGGLLVPIPVDADSRNI